DLGRRLHGKHRWRGARKSWTGVLRRRDTAAGWDAARVAREIYRPPHEQRRRILRADRGARLRRGERDQAIARAQRFAVDRESDEGPIQGEASGLAPAARTREEASRGPRCVRNSIRPARTESRSRRRRQRRARQHRRREACVRVRVGKTREPRWHGASHIAFRAAQDPRALPRWRTGSRRAAGLRRERGIGNYDSRIVSQLILSFFWLPEQRTQLPGLKTQAIADP